MRIGAGRWKNAELPRAGDDVRPVPGRLRTSLFSVLLPRLEGAVVLDLCAGVGGFGLEAVSRGAARAVLVDRDRATAKALANWVASRQASDVVIVVVADATRGGWPKGPYDLVFLDPPFSVWGAEAEARAFLAAAVLALAPDGIAAVKCPGNAGVPADSRWRQVDRRTQGGVSYVLLASSGPIAPPAPPTGAPQVHNANNAATGAQGAEER